MPIAAAVAVAAAAAVTEAAAAVAAVSASQLLGTLTVKGPATGMLKLLTHTAHPMANPD